ncbi:MAG: hypothetical protein WC329_01745 [Candidatus Omnitrophota bacterium]|jgi:hypothetical protein
MTTKTHTKGKVAEGKKPVNWRLFEDVVDNIVKEAIEKGYGEKGAATLVNSHFRAYYAGKTMRRDK